MNELTQLPNIGNVIAEQLNEVGIFTYDELKQAGAEQAWTAIRKNDPSACINRLLGIEGAIQQIKKTALSDTRKAELRAFYHQAVR